MQFSVQGNNMYISNNFYQKNTNISSVFETVWRNENISRSAISKSLDLYRSTITNIISYLIEKDLILEGVVGQSTSKGGRRPIFLSVNKHFGCIIGVDINTEKYSVSVISVDGSVLSSFSSETPQDEENKDDPEQCFVYALDNIIASLLKPVSDLKIPVLGICVSVPGIVDCDKGVIKESFSFGLNDFDFAETFYSRYGVPCIAENDARCLAWRQFAMQRGDRVRKEDFMCVLSKNMEGKKVFGGKTQKGIGIGLSIAVKGSLIYGSHYCVGEYISTSWRGNTPRQSGLSEDVIDSLFKDDESYSLWVEDLFKTLTVYIPLLQPERILLYGQSEKRANLIRSVIAERVPQFAKAMEKFNSSLELLPYNQLDLAEGAAYKYLQQMFVVMETDNDSWIKSYDWERAFKLRQKGLKQFQLHV